MRSLTQLFEFVRRNINGGRVKADSKPVQALWKGLASYYDVVVDGQINRDAAWSYEDPRPSAYHIKDMIGFWHGIEIRD
jgi:uncharacterized protein (DUF427 family)